MLKNPQIEEDAADELNLLAAIWAAGEYLMLQEGERTVKVGEIEISCKDRSEALLSMKDLMMAQKRPVVFRKRLSREDGVTHGKTQRTGIIFAPLRQ